MRLTSFKLPLNGEIDVRIREEVEVLKQFNAIYNVTNVP